MQGGADERPRADGSVPRAAAASRSRTGVASVAARAAWPAPSGRVREDAPRTLLTGWFSFRDGEATAGDILALRSVQRDLDRNGHAYDVAFSPVFEPGGLSLEDALPEIYGRVIFVCGPLHGPQLELLHRKFARCVRIAMGVSVIDPDSAAVRGFDGVFARDGVGVGREDLDLSAAAPAGGAVPVVGVALTHGQYEYRLDRAHEEVGQGVAAWLHGKDCARLELDTRLDRHDWRHCATPEQLLSVFSRLDLIVTDRLHGLVLALKQGVPALAVDPVRGGAKVSAQARACRWPALVTTAAVGDERAWNRELDEWWDWCLGAGAELARERARWFADLTEPAPRLEAGPG